MESLETKKTTAAMGQCILVGSRNNKKGLFKAGRLTLVHPAVSYLKMAEEGIKLAFSWEEGAAEVVCSVHLVESRSWHGALIRKKQRHVFGLMCGREITKLR